MIKINNIKELKNKIYNENCISKNPNEGMNRIPDKSIDMILCDLPYGTTRCKWDSIIPFDKLWEQYNRIIKDNGAIVLFSSQPFTSYLIISNIKNYKYEWIWHKNKGGNPLNAKKMPMKQHENIVVFYKKYPTYNPQMEERYGQGKERIKYKVQGGRFKEDRVYGDVDHIVRNTKYSNLRYPQTVQFYKVERGLHPTQKPVPLLEYLIKTYTNENEIVLDNCIGSGSTIIACINTNRNYIGFELDGNYFNIAENRINTYLNNINK